MSAGAQCFETNFGTLMPRGANAPGIGDDSLFDLQPMNITFPMGGVAASYTHAHVGTNGVMFLTNGTASGATATGYSTLATTMVTNLRGTATQPPRIAPYWRDLNITVANSGGVFFNNTIPGKFVVTWRNAAHFGQSSPIFTLQAQLFADGSVVFFYNGTTQNTALTPLCGISQGALVADPGVSDLSVATAGVSTSKIVYQTFATLNTFDLQNTAVTFTPNAGGGYDTTPSACVPASNTNFGTGCTIASATWYESFAAGANDTGSTAIHMAPNGNGGYDMTAGTPTAYVHTGVGLALGDDANGSLALPSAFNYPGGSTTALTICSNGFIWMQPNTSTDFSPSIAELFSNAARLALCWTDLRPDGALNIDNVFAEVDVPNNKAYVTWVNVPTFAPGGVVNAQVEFDLTTHHVNITYGTVMSPAASIVGWTPGTGVSTIDAGSRDISATIGGGFSTSATEVGALSLAASPTPVLGSNVTLTASNIRANLSFTAVFFSFGQTAPTPLLTYGYDSPGCHWYLDTTLQVALNGLLFLNPTDSLIVTIPTDPSWANIDVFFQAASLAPAATPSGVISSNAVRSFLNTF